MIRLSQLRLTPRLTLAFVLFAIVLLGFIGVLAYYSGRSGLEAATLSALASMAAEKQAALTDWVNERQSDLRVFATSPNNREILSALISSEPGSPEARSAHDRLVQELQADTGRENSFLALWVMDPETGRVIAATDPSTEGTFNEDRPYFINGKVGPYIQNPYYSLTLQQVTMTVSIPVRSADGQLRAVLAAQVNLDEMNAIITRQTGLQQTEDAFLVNTSNLFVTQPRLLSDPAVLQRGVHTEAVNRCLAGNSGTMFTNDYRGLPALIVYRWLPEREMCLIVKIDQAEALEPVQAFGEALGVIGGLALLAAAVLAVGLARTLTRPILALQAGVMRFGQGELDVRLSATSGDELGVLAQAFNTMAAALGEKDRQLRGYADQLEQKVEERTAALQTSEGELRALFAAMTDIIFVLDGQGRYLKIAPTNPPPQLKPTSDLIGKTLHEVFPAAQADFLLVCIREALETHQAITTEQPLLMNDTETWFAATVAPMVGSTVLWVLRDITERRRAAEVIRESEARLQTIFDVLPVGISLLTPDRQILKMNPALQRIVQMPTEGLMDGAYKARQYIHPDGTPISAAELPSTRALVEHQAIYDVEIGIVKDDGSILWTSVSAAPLTSTESGVVTVTLDITEHKRAEDALRESEQRYRSLFENMLNGFAYCKMYFDQGRPQDFIYLDVNNAFETLTGLKNVVGKKVSEVIPGLRESDPELFEIYGRVALTGQPTQFENYVSSLGIWFSISVYSPHKEYFVAVFDVITKRKQAEEALRRYAERLASINRLDRIIASSLEIDLVYDSFVAELLTLVPLDRTSIVLLNEAGDQWQVARQWTQGQAEIQAGKWRRVEGSAVDWLVTNRIPFLENELGERGTWLETELLHREGLRSRLLLPLIVQERLVGTLTVASRQPAAFSEEDQNVLLTIANQLAIAIQNSNLYLQVQRHAAELEQRVLQRTAQLEAANKELEAFSYSVSHDLRAPLRGIDGYARIILRDYASLVPGEGQRRLQALRDMAQHMGHLIDDLLAFSRLNRQPLQKQSVDFNTLVKEVLAELNSDIAQRQVEIVLGELPDGQADRSLLKQVFINLLSNALKYTRPREVSRIEVGTQRTNGLLTYFVRDNGVGFDMQYADKLFGVFQRLHSSDEFEGTGVGLAIVQRIINRHGGRVWAEGTLDAGASFFFTLEGDSANDGR